jgi:hypothetical protein
LRNSVAHGLEVPVLFREKRDIVDANGARINIDDCRYSQVMMESALFLLARSLREIMVGGLVDVVKDESRWKQTLKVGTRLAQARTTNVAVRLPPPVS